MVPRMRNLMLKISRENNEEYFQLNEEEREQVAHNIARTVINSAAELLNGYTSDELQDIMELSINNLASLEEQFIELEMYCEALMMRDAINKIANDISELVNKKL